MKHIAIFLIILSIAPIVTFIIGQKTTMNARMERVLSSGITISLLWLLFSIIFLLASVAIIFERMITINP